MRATRLKLVVGCVVAGCICGGVAVWSPMMVGGQPVDQTWVHVDHVANSRSTLEQAWEDLASSRDTDVFRAMLALSATPRPTLAFLKDRLFPVKADPRLVARLLQDLDNKTPAVRQRAETDLEYLGGYVRGYLRKALADRPSPELRLRLEELLSRLPYDHMEAVADLHQQLQANPKDLVVRAKLIDSLHQGIDYVELQRQGELLHTRLNQPLSDQERKVLADEYAALQKLASSFRAGSYAPPSSYHPSSPAGPAIVVAVPRSTGQFEPPQSWIRAKRAIAVVEHIATPEARALLRALAEGEPDAMPTREAKAALDRIAGPSTARAKQEPETVPAQSAPPTRMQVTAPPPARVRPVPEAALTAPVEPPATPAKRFIPF